LRYARVFLLAGRNFNENNCELRASALTFYTLLSIVPVVAMAFGVARGFGLELALEKQLLEKFPLQEDVFIQVFAFANNLLAQAKGGLVAGIGLVVLFWAVIRVLGNIEESFNEIWGVKKPRTFGRKFNDYLSFILVCPLLFVMASSVNVFLQAQFPLLLAKLSFLGPAVFPLVFFLKLLPFLIVWVLFTFVYSFMPNTRVNLKSAILAGIIGGTVYQAAQIIYIAFQIGVARYNAIYGSFAALPLFLVWLQLSWKIVLLGGEISFAHQNIETYEFERDCLSVSRSHKSLLSLSVMHVAIEHFKKGESPIATADIIERFDMPVKLAQDILFELVQSGLLSEICADEKNPRYQPAKDINGLTIKSVLEALEQRGCDIQIRETHSFRQIAASLKQFDEILRKSPGNKLLKDIE